MELVLKSGLPFLSLATDNPSVRRCYGAEYNSALRRWLLPAYPPFLEFTLHDLEVTEVASRKTAESALASLSPLKSSDASPHILQPYEHQTDSVTFALNNPAAGIFLDCGLGKTKVAIDYLRVLKAGPYYVYDQPPKVLILAPKAVIHKWGDEFVKHAGAGAFDVSVVDGSVKKKTAILNEDHEVYVATHALIRGKYMSQLERMNFTVMIIDESHTLKSPKSNTTAAAIRLSAGIQRKLALSGTPILGTPMHLYGQLRFLSPLLTEKNAFMFARKFLITKKMRNINIPVGVKNLDILRHRVDTVAVQYSAAECADLPEIRTENLAYEPCGDQLRDYNRIVSLSPPALAAALNTPTEAVFATRLTKAQQILSGFRIESNKDMTICDSCEHLPACVKAAITPYTNKCHIAPIPPVSTMLEYKNNPKLDLLRETVDSICVSGNKVVIWARFLKEIADITALLTKSKLGHVVVSGKTTAKASHAAYVRFNDDPTCMVYVGQIACGIGIDLIAASYTIYYSLDYDLGHYTQSLKRVHRIGQKNKVTIYHLVAAGTIEEYIATVLSHKQGVSDAVTLSLPCTFCPENTKCSAASVELFDKECKYTRSSNKRTAKLTTIGEKFNEDNFGHKRSDD